MKNLETMEEFKTLTQDNKPFVALFSADRCGDCRALKPILPGIEEEYTNKFNFAVVDRDKFDGLAQEYDVLGIPSFVVFQKDKVIDTYINGKRKSREEVTQFLDQVELS